MSILLVILSVLMVVVVLIQNTKGGGLDSSFASQTSAFGAKRTTDIIEKITWGLFASIALLCIVITANSGSNDDEENAIRNATKKEVVAPQQGTNPPAQQGE